ncbi:MAG: NAD(P)/FAD-dependent oxidoreductase [Pseudoflavonifractor sp.]|nr:NAD(P)/FAD-dependent oxidoreductase [Pseudoflavonifractor sp.]
MRETVDVAVIGCGEAGIYAAYELTRQNPGLKVLVLEQGRDIYSRSCPIVAGKVRSCIQCPVCDTMCGFGGAGAFSDGKFNFTTAFGGWLTDFMPAKEVMELIGYVDDINVAHGATQEVYSTSSPAARALEKKALEFDLHLLQAQVKHLGTENNLRILQNIFEDMKEHVDFRFHTAVEKIDVLGETGYRLTTAKGDEVDCTWLVAGPGRSGAEWFSEQCKGLGIQLINNQVDIGVRVELPARVFEHITDVVYESKLVYRTKQYGDQVRTFCMNPYGHVVAENVEGINTVNGHSYADPALQSKNTNFALLVSNRFTEPFNEPYRYGKHIASLSNMLAGGVLVQRFGDLVKGVRSNDHRMSKSFTRPTLTAAVPGDLSLALPKRQLDDIIEMIYQLDKLAPGTANYDTLLYGAEVKFYSSRLTLSGELETDLPRFFAIGDGAGITRGLAQAGASGVKVARVISDRLKNGR